MRIREVEDERPLSVAVFGPRGNPNLFLTEEMRGGAVKAGKSGDCMFFYLTFVLITDFCVQIWISTRKECRTPLSWLHTCPTDSLASQAPLEAETKADKETPIN